MNIFPEALQQLREAYRTMASRNYRPCAPSDGFGNVTTPLDELDIEAEADTFAARHWAQEDDCGTYWLGFPNHRERVAPVYLLEAARCCSSASTDWSLMLAKLACEELESIVADPDWKPQILGPACGTDAEAVAS